MLFSRNKLFHWLRDLAQRFSLLEDKADDDQIDSTLRAGVALRGTNLWVLMFAILIASIGLNVNSAAVVIGAMLISPLMGPIMGIGYAVAIDDTELLRKSFRNLLMAAGISLLVSTLYFMVTPLSDAHSELLARTTPTIWDVLIAFFGGLAGIIGVTRKEKSNVIPGVAIATALMPPLCTAGYGLANLDWRFFGGAFYLFAVNTVYIAISTMLIIRLINPVHKKYTDARQQKRIKNILSFVIVFTIVPSIYLATRLVQEELYQNRFNQFLAKEPLLKNNIIVSSKIDAGQHMVDLTLIGEEMDDATLKQIQERMRAMDDRVQLLIHQNKSKAVNEAAVRDSILSDLYHRILNSQNMDGAAEQQKLSQALKTREALWRDVIQELSVQYPSLGKVYLGEMVDGADEDGLVLVALISRDQPLPDADEQHILHWLKVRLKTEKVSVVVSEKPAL